MSVSNWTRCAVFAVAATIGANAGAQQAGLVNVNIGDINVLNDIADFLDVNVSEIPVTVQAPIGVAANVCNVAVNVLATAAQGGAAECDAQQTSMAFNHVVQRQLNLQ